MLLNRFNAFAVGRRVPKARFVGQYACDFAASTTANATIPVADLRYDPANRQLLVFWAIETAIPLSMTIAGVQAAKVADDGALFQTAFAARNSSMANIAVTVTQSAANSENGGISVYEIADAEDLTGCLRFTHSAGGGVINGVVAPADHVLIAGAFNATDTATFTWTNLTADADTDQGDTRASCASNLAPAAAKTRLTITAAGDRWNPAADGHCHRSAGRHPHGQGRLYDPLECRCWWRVIVQRRG